MKKIKLRRKLSIKEVIEISNIFDLLSPIKARDDYTENEIGYFMVKFSGSPKMMSIGITKENKGERECLNK